jgi:hypothetical protein
LRQEKLTGSYAKDQYVRDKALFEEVLVDNATELRDKVRDYEMRLSHYRTCSKIIVQRSMDLEATVDTLNNLMSAMEINKPVAIAPIIAEPVAVPVVVPAGYYRVNFTSVVSRVQYPVVCGPLGGHYTLRSATVLRNMTATQVANMIPT